MLPFLEATPVNLIFQYKISLWVTNVTALVDVMHYPRFAITHSMYVEQRFTYSGEACE